jgi:hypothetical protein
LQPIISTIIAVVIMAMKATVLTTKLTTVAAMIII